MAFFSLRDSNNEDGHSDSLGSVLMMVIMKMVLCPYDDDGSHSVMMVLTGQSHHSHKSILLMTSTTGAPPPTRSTAWTEETAYQNTGQAILGRGEPLSGFHHHHPQSKSLF